MALPLAALLTRYSTAAAVELQEKLRKSGKLEAVGYSSTVYDTPMETSLPAPEVADMQPQSLQRGNGVAGDCNLDGEGTDTPRSPAHQTKVPGLLPETTRAEIAPGKGMHVSVAPEEPRTNASEHPRSPEYEDDPAHDLQSDDEPAISPSRFACP